MNDLMEVFAEARFGKRAFLESIFGRSVDPKKRAVRDKIEELIREERRKREDAKAALEYGKYRIEHPDKSWLGFGEDVIRSAIPGMRLTASAKADALTKIAQDPDEAVGGRAWDIAHAGAAGVGGGLGYAAGTGHLGDVGSAVRAGKSMGDELTGRLANAVGKKEFKALKQIMGRDPTAVVLAGQKRIPVVSTVAEKISPSYWMRRLNKKPVTAAQAKALIARELATEGVKGKAARKVLKELPDIMSTARSKIVTSLANKGKKLPRLHGKAGLAIGALLLSAPFILPNLIGSRKLRASGGTAGQASLHKAKKLIEEANKMKEQRQVLLRRV